MDSFHRYNKAPLPIPLLRTKGQGTLPWARSETRKRQMSLRAWRGCRLWKTGQKCSQDSPGERAHLLWRRNAHLAAGSEGSSICYTLDPCVNHSSASVPRKEAKLVTSRPWSLDPHGPSRLPKNTSLFNLRESLRFPALPWHMKQPGENPKLQKHPECKGRA